MKWISRLTSNSQIYVRKFWFVGRKIKRSRVRSSLGVFCGYIFAIFNNFFTKFSHRKTYLLIAKRKFNLKKLQFFLYASKKDSLPKACERECYTFLKRLKSWNKKTDFWACANCWMVFVCMYVWNSNHVRRDRYSSNE